MTNDEDEICFRASGFVIVSSFVIRASSFALLVAKRLHRIETHGGARREITSSQTHEEQDHGDEREARRVVRRDSVETAGQKLSEEKRADESDHKTGHDQPQSLAGDEPQDVAGLRAESHAHSDLLCPLPDRIRHHAVESERGEKKREPGEDREEGAEKFPVPK